MSHSKDKKNNCYIEPKDREITNHKPNLILSPKYMGLQNLKRLACLAENIVFVYINNYRCGGVDFKTKIWAIKKF